MVNFNAIAVMMVIYAICHSTALLRLFYTLSSCSEALKTVSGFQSKGLNTQDTPWMCKAVHTVSRAGITPYSDLTETHQEKVVVF